MLTNNLIDNAIKYTPKESPVTIGLSEMNNRIIFQVKDEGKGIVAGEKEKIFTNMSKRAADLLRDDIDMQGPVKVSDMENLIGLVAQDFWRH